MKTEYKGLVHHGISATTGRYIIHTVGCNFVTVFASWGGELGHVRTADSSNCRNRFGEVALKV